MRAILIQTLRHTVYVASRKSLGIALVPVPLYTFYDWCDASELVLAAARRTKKNMQLRPTALI